MFSKVFRYEEQPWKIDRNTGIASRIIVYSPELTVMEWTFKKANSVIPPHDHYHVQSSYVRKGSAMLILDDGSRTLAKEGDSVYFAPNEKHSVITQEDNTVILDVFTPIRLDHLECHAVLPEDKLPPYEI